MRTYLIAFTLRNGSTLLCDYLASNGFGQPTEYFQYPFGVANRWHYDRLGVSPDDFKGYLRELFNQCADNGIFGAKLTWDHKNVLLEEAQRQDASIEDIHDIFPDLRWVYLKRQDKIAQAVSTWRAAKTGRWHSPDPVSENNQPEYDYFGIFRYYFTILVEEHLWDDYFQRLKLQPAIIYYEDLIHDTRNTVMQLMDYIQGQNKIIKNLDELNLSTPLSKMRDEYSERIKTYFMKDLYNIGASKHWESRQEIVQRWLNFFAQEHWKEP